jgi:sugar O-acyltransferase (sialic acid O-acetyltransferase NeuD family)
VKLAFIGYGVLGRQVEAMITETLPVAPAARAYFDDNAHAAGAGGAFPFAAHTSAEFADYRFYVCIGYKHLGLKQQIVDRLLELGRTVPRYVDPSSYVHPSVQIGSGSMIYPGCTIDRNTRIGNATWIHDACVISHDGSIGDCCWLAPGVTVSGHVTVGASTFIGAGSTLANDIAVGAQVIVGLATAVTRSIGDGVSVIGNPMRILDRPLRLV